MNAIELEVTKVTPTVKSKRPGFIHTLKHNETKVVQTPFGQKTQVEQVTYYLKLDIQNPVGRKAIVDLDQFEISERPYVVDDPTSDLHGQTITVKWLHLK